MASYFTPAEIELLKVGKWANETIAYRDVSMTQLSIARHYGGAQLPGGSFTYIPHTDELIRDDVLRYVTKLRREEYAAQRRAQRDGAAEAQFMLGL